MLKIIKILLNEKKRAWDSKFPLALWANRVIVKKAIGCAPFDLICGTQARILQNNLGGMYKFIQKYDDEIVHEMQVRMDDILQLEQTKREASTRNTKLQLQIKNLYDKKVLSRKFDLEDLVLLWNSRMEDKGKNGKFDPIWLGPYLIHEKWGEDSYFIKVVRRYSGNSCLWTIPEEVLILKVLVFP